MYNFSVLLLWSLVLNKVSEKRGFIPIDRHHSYDGQDCQIWTGSSELKKNPDPRLTGYIRGLLVCVSFKVDSTHRLERESTGSGSLSLSVRTYITTSGSTISSWTTLSMSQAPMVRSISIPSFMVGNWGSATILRVTYGFSYGQAQSTRKTSSS